MHFFLVECGKWPIPVNLWLCAEHIIVPKVLGYMTAAAVETVSMPNYQSLAHQLSKYPTLTAEPSDTKSCSSFPSQHPTPRDSQNFLFCFQCSDFSSICELSSNKPTMQVSCTCIWFCIEVVKRTLKTMICSLRAINLFRREFCLNDSSVTGLLSHLKLVVNHRIEEKREKAKKYGATV